MLTCNIIVVGQDPDEEEAMSFLPGIDLPPDTDSEEPEIVLSWLS